MSARYVVKTGRGAIQRKAATHSILDLNSAPLTSWEWTTSRSTTDRRCDLRVPGVYEGGEMRSRGLEDGSASWGPQHPATVPTSGMRCCSRMTAGLWPPWGCQRLGLVRIRRRDISYSRKINCTVRSFPKNHLLKSLWSSRPNIAMYTDPRLKVVNFLAGTNGGGSRSRTISLRLTSRRSVSALSSSVYRPGHGSIGGTGDHLPC